MPDDMTTPDHALDAVPAKHFAKPPYSPWSAPNGQWHGVLNRDGVNCLTFKSKPGAVFVQSAAEAEAIAKAWNEAAP
jgi:hypothetical protein